MSPFDFLARIRSGLMSAIDLPPEINRADKRPRQAIGFDTKSGGRSLPVNAKQALIVGQMLAAGGTGVASVVYPIINEGDAALIWAPGSMMDMMARAFFKANPNGKLFGVGVVDPVGGTVATLANTFATNALQNGAYVLVFGGKLYVTPITKGDTPTVIATAHVAVVNAATELPFTAANAAGVVTYTSKAKGVEQNQLKLRGYFSLSGMGTTATLTTTYANFTGGTLTADLAPAYAAAAAVRYHERAIGLGDSVTGQAARDDVNTKGDAEHGKGEVAIQGIISTLSASTALALAINGVRNQVKAIRGTGTPPWSVAAAVAGVKCSESRAAMPYNYLPIAGIEAPAVADRWTEPELKTMLDNGVSPLVVVPGDIVCMYRSISTYFTNPQSAIDYTQLDIMVIQCFDRVREALTGMFQQKYSRNEWADDDSDGLLPDFVATPTKVKLDAIDVARDLEREGTVQHVEQHADEIEVNKVSTGCEFSFPSDFVDSLQTIFGKVTRVTSPAR
jgi:phage tail sheath gpL-like